MLYLNKQLTYDQAVKRYGAIDLASLHWPEASTWIKLLEVPAGAFPNWKVMETQIPVTHIALNTDLHEPLKAAFNNIVNRGLEQTLYTFDGAFNIRLVRGSKVQVSTHAYGLAIDINAGSNRLGGPVTINPDLAECFIREGFDWGARFHRVDGMHFSRAWE